MFKLSKKECVGREISVLYIVRGVSLPFSGICLWKKKNTICLFTKKGGVSIVLKILLSNIIDLNFKDNNTLLKSFKVANLYKRYLKD